MSLALSWLESASVGLGGDPLLNYEREPEGLGGMSRPQFQLHSAQDRKRFFRAANGIGKTIAGGAEAWWHLLGRHPFRETPGPGQEGWLLVSDLKQGWKAVSKAMRFLEPRDALDPACKYVDGVGYMYRSMKIVKIREELGGGLMVGKGCQQDILSMEGDKIAWLWVDEPPKQSHWNGCRSRVTRTGGPMWVTLTPINRPVGWLRLLVDGDPDTAAPAIEQDWWHEVFALCQENAPHIAPDILRYMLAEVDAWEVEQRIRGGWEGFTRGRTFSHFTDGTVLVPDEMDRLIEATSWDSDGIRLGFDHGEGSGKNVAFLGLTSPRLKLIVGESSPKEEGATPHQVADGVLKMLDRCGVPVLDIDKAYGDTNSAGMLGFGQKYNTFLERAFADILGYSECPFRIQTPNKRGGSVKMGEKAMNIAMQEGGFFVSASCTRFIHAARHYTGTERDLKDPLDGARYMFADKLLSWRSGAPVILRRG